MVQLPTEVVYKGHDWWAFLSYLPGVYGVGKTPEQAENELSRALKTYLRDRDYRFAGHESEPMASD